LIVPPRKYLPVCFTDQLSSYNWQDNISVSKAEQIPSSKSLLWNRFKFYKSLHFLRTVFGTVFIHLVKSAIYKIFTSLFHQPISYNWQENITFSNVKRNKFLLANHCCKIALNFINRCIFEELAYIVLKSVRKTHVSMFSCHLV
jgi:hypothetical protein